MTRKNYILHLLRDKHRVGVEELCTALEVSNITIRRDLKQLEEEGLLSRIHGGASLPFSQDLDHRRISSKEKLFIAEKKRIAKKVGEIITKDSTVFINGGSTTASCLEALNATHLEVFTNNATCISTQHNSEINIQYLGGTLDKYSQSFYGNIALQTLENIKADFCILGANAFHLEEGVSSYFFNEAAINRTMVKNTLGKVILVIDNSKINTISNYKICDLHDIDIIITDRECPPEFSKQIEEQNIQLILA